MNTRERYLATMAFERIDRPLYWECGYWPSTVRRWYREGLPRKQGIPDELPDGGGVYGKKALDVEEALGLDPRFDGIAINTRHLYPPFPVEVLEDHGEWVLQRNGNGAIEKQRKDRTSMRAIVRGLVQTRDDWERIKAERLQPKLEGRVPGDWDQQVARWQNRDYPLGGIACEHWLNLVELFGMERLLMLFHDDPQWLKEMLSYLSEFFIALVEPILKQVVPESCTLGGDFCYRSGPIFSPATFREFLLPEFRKVATLFHDYGVPSVVIHTDGDFRPLIPLFLEAGATAVHPFEVTNGQNVAEVRKAYPRLVIYGGIDKKALAEGKEAIDRELAAKELPFMVRQSGFIPYVDHFVPPDVSWENFVYYRRRLAELARP